MKVDLKDLKQVMSWIEKHSSDVHVSIRIEDNQMNIHLQDTYATQVEIKVYESGTRLPKILKEENLYEKV